MTQEKKLQQTPHTLILENRSTLNITGLSDVDSFDEKLILVYTNMGSLAIKGKDLHINKLSLETGEMILDGEIISLTYTDNQSKNLGLLAKIFK